MPYGIEHIGLMAKDLGNLAQLICRPQPLV